MLIKWLQVHACKIWPLALLLLVLLGAGFVHSNGLPVRIAAIDVKSTDHSAFIDKYVHLLSRCSWDREQFHQKKGFPDIAECLVGSEKISDTLFIGDSHGEHYFAGLTNWAQNTGQSFYTFLAPGCPIFLRESYRVQHKANYDFCPSYIEQLHTLLKQNPNITRIIYATRSDYFTEENLPHEIPSFLLLSGGESRDQQTSRKNFSVLVNQMVQQVNNKNLQLIILGQVPIHDTYADKCMRRSSTPMHRFVALDFVHCRQTDIALTQSRLAFANNLYFSLAQQHTNLHFFNPAEYFCKDNACYAILNDTLLYRDDDHLNIDGSLFIGQFFDF